MILDVFAITSQSSFLVFRPQIEFSRVRTFVCTVCLVLNIRDRRYHEKSNPVSCIRMETIVVIYSKGFPSVNSTRLCSNSAIWFQVIDHYENPRNVGSLNKDDSSVGTGLVGAPACGDVMKLQVSIDTPNHLFDCFPKLCFPIWRKKLNCTAQWP